MKYGFIGCGNMGGSLAKALARSTKNILLCDPIKAEELAAALGCGFGSALEVVETCDRIFLGVKPNMLREALAPLQEKMAERKPLLISMAAGMELATVEKYAGSPLPIIRIMPNTPVSVGKGVIGYTCNELVTEEMVAGVLEDMKYAGTWDCVAEELMDTVSALSGSGPAYMYHFVEVLCEGAVACGMTEEQALTYAICTMEGAAEMMRTSGQKPGPLRVAVCSPGGSTLAGLKALEEKGFREAVIACVQAAYNRNKELGKQ